MQGWAAHEVHCYLTVDGAMVALGSTRQHDTVLNLLANLRQFPNVTHELLRLVAAQHLWDDGLSAVYVPILDP